MWRLITGPGAVEPLTAFHTFVLLTSQRIKKRGASGLISYAAIIFVSNCGYAILGLCKLCHFV